MTYPIDPESDSRRVDSSRAAASLPEAAELARDFLLDHPADGACIHIGGSGEHAGRLAAPLPCVVAIGAFDGVHRGHRDLLARACRDAEERGLAAVAVTFDPDPDEVVAPHPAPKLTNKADRLNALAASGPQVAVVPFTRELAALDHAEFFEDVLAPQLDIRAVHVGSDFRLGAGGAATLEVIKEWGDRRGISVVGHELLCDAAGPITATRIRAHVACGDVASARADLGRRHAVRGVVVRGRGQGTGMGFPTANILVDGSLQLPADGVYAGFALVDGCVWPAAINAGIPPMFADSVTSARLEANLIGFTGDLYGKTVGIAFDERLRPSQSFASIQELIDVVNADISTVRSRFGDTPVRLS